MRVRACAVLAVALAVGSAVAVPQLALDDQSEVTELEHVGLASSTAIMPSSAADIVAPSPSPLRTDGSASVLAHSSSSSSLSFARDADVDANVARIPIDAQAFADDERSSNSSVAVIAAPHLLSNSSSSSGSTADSVAPTGTTTPSNSSSNDANELSQVSATEELPQLRSVPSRPTLVIAKAFDGRAEVTWRAPDDDGADAITSYDVSWFDAATNALVGTQVVARIESLRTMMSPTAASRNGTKSINTNGTAHPNGIESRNSTVGGTPATTLTTSVPTTAVIAHLRNGDAVAFKVRARNVHGVSVWSAPSPVVSPLQPPDLCAGNACSGRGMCFPTYEQQRPTRTAGQRTIDGTDDTVESSSAGTKCICHPGFAPPDCSAKSNATEPYVWTVSDWSPCSSGCSGGTRTRTALCVNTTVAASPAARVDDALCSALQKPSLTAMCNSMECGSKLVAVKYDVEMRYDDVLFSPEAVAAFELAFTAEVAAALQVPTSRLEVVALKRGSIAVYFHILPAARTGDLALVAVVETLKSELSNASSTLRTRGTFARRVEPTGVRLSFTRADETLGDDGRSSAQDISVLGLAGTVVVLGVCVAVFGSCLRRRYDRMTKSQEAYARDSGVTASSNNRKASSSEMKRMGIRTMA